MRRNRLLLSVAATILHILHWVTVKYGHEIAISELSERTDSGFFFFMYVLPGFLFLAFLPRLVGRITSLAVGLIDILGR